MKFTGPSHTVSAPPIILKVISKALGPRHGTFKFHLSNGQFLDCPGEKMFKVLCGNRVSAKDLQPGAHVDFS